MFALVPYLKRDFTYAGDLTSFINQLETLVARTKLLRFKLPDDESQTYEGTFDSNSFKINRIVIGRNSFMPVVIGKLSIMDERVLVSLEFRLHFLVAAFIAMFITLLVLLNQSAFILISGTIAIYVVMILSFNIEVSKDMNKLASILGIDPALH